MATTCNIAETLWAEGNFEKLLFKILIRQKGINLEIGPFYRFWHFFAQLSISNLKVNPCNWHFRRSLAGTAKRQWIKLFWNRVGKCWELKNKMEHLKCNFSIDAVPEAKNRQVGVAPVFTAGGLRFPPSVENPDFTFSASKSRTCADCGCIVVISLAVAFF